MSLTLTDTQPHEGSANTPGPTLATLRERLSRLLLSPSSGPRSIIVRAGLSLGAVVAVSVIVAETGGAPNFYSNLYYLVVVYAAVVLPFPAALLVAVMCGVGPSHRGLQLVESLNRHDWGVLLRLLVLVLMASLVKLLVRRTEQAWSSAQAIIKHLAYHDALTGLPNRRMLDERIASLVTSDRRIKSYCVMALDLDRFKRVNDRLGHPAGDQLLRGVAERLLKLFREDDTVARVGGDEFVILLPSVSDVEVIDLAAQRIIAALARPIDVGGERVTVGVSIGISVYPLDSQEPESLLRHADAALYRAKELGRKNYQYYADGRRVVHAVESAPRPNEG